jgi:phospholipid/cholesterol/gamma-HCH transport system substrate-binding protein
MQTTPGRDLAVGIFVLVGLAALAWLSVQVGGATLGGPGGLRLEATFDEIGGLTPRAPVVISGVKVGRVERIGLDDDLRARVVLEVDQSLELPIDTSASIRTSGLLGDQFIALAPGAEDQLLADGEEISFTESALSLEKLVGTLVHNVNLGGDGQ